MERFQIIPIKVGHYLGLEHSNFSYGHFFGEKIQVPIIMYLLKSSNTTILVDTGITTPEWINKYHPPIEQTADEFPIQALHNLGLTPDMVDFVVITHLHYDHCFNNCYFTQSPIIIQKKEWEYALNPLPCHYATYESHYAGFLPPFLKDIEKQKIRLIDGEQELVSGIRLIPLPGHSPGFQGVMVATDNGDRFIVSDTVPIYKNWEHTPRLPSGLHVNLADYYATMEKIASYNCPILPGHDEKVLELHRDGKL